MTSINTILPIDEIEVNGTTIPLKPVVDTKFARSLIEGSFIGTEIPSEYLEGLTKIRDGIFAYSNIVSFEMPDTVTDMGLTKSNCIGAFTNCTSLTNVKLSKNIEIIPTKAFDGCSNLKTLEIPYGVKGIGHLSSGTVSTLSIGNGTGIKELHIPNSVEYLSTGCFCFMKELETITLPNTIKNTDEFRYTFQGCESLKTVTIPQNFKNIGFSAFSGCTSLSEIIIPDNVKSISAEAFFNCSSLTKIDLNNIDYMTNSVFKNCSSLANVIMNEGFERIFRSTFENCISLPTIQIPSSVTQIENLVFSGCSSLTEMIVLNTTPPTLQNINAISSATTKIYVPYGYKTAYETATNWSSLLTRETNPVTFIELNEDGSKPVEETEIEVPDTSILL